MDGIGERPSISVRSMDGGARRAATSVWAMDGTGQRLSMSVQSTDGTGQRLSTSVAHLMDTSVQGLSASVQPRNVSVHRPNAPVQRSSISGLTRCGRDKTPRTGQHPGVARRSFCPTRHGLAEPFDLSRSRTLQKRDFPNFRVVTVVTVTNYG